MFKMIEIPKQICCLNMLFKNLFVAADFKKFLETKRETILALDDMKIVVNKKAKFVAEFEDQAITGMAGSFRKLQVD